MQTISDYVNRLRRAAKGALMVTEADVIREVQAEAFQAGYAQAARELLAVAVESQERTDSLIARAADAGIVHAPLRTN